MSPMKRSMRTGRKMCFNKMALLRIHVQITVVLLCIFGLSLKAFQVTANHGPMLVIEISETADKDTLLLNASEYASCTVTSLSPIQRKPYIHFDHKNCLELLEALDLEILELTGDSTTLMVNYSCDNTALVLSLNITPVNEFAPIFVGSPFTLQITEDIAMGAEVLYLGNKWQDRDKVKYGDASKFSLQPYAISAFDGRGRFVLDNDSLVTATVFDYETMARNKYYMLNVSIEDDGGRISFTTVNVTITDVDDNPPVFTSCSNGQLCAISAYTATIDRLFQGVLLISPKPIFAVDGDTGLNANIQYRIDADADIAAYLEMNKDSGEVDVSVPLVNLSNWELHNILNISVYVIATEESVNSYQANISLIIYVYKEFPTTHSTLTSTPIPGSPDSTSDGQPVNVTEPAHSKFNTLLFIEVFVPVCVVVCVSIIVAIIVWKTFKKLKDAKYRVGASKREVNEDHGISHIDTLSSTPINPYELISIYARLSTDGKREDGPSSSNTEERNDICKYEDTSDVSGNNQLYSKVDTRIQRKRQNQLIEFLETVTDEPEAEAEEDVLHANEPTMKTHELNVDANEPIV